eukprot:4199628-Amphidinium_carterae.1
MQTTSSSGLDEQKRALTTYALVSFGGLDDSLKLVMPLITAGMPDIACGAACPSLVQCCLQPSIFSGKAGSLEANLRSLESWGLDTTSQRSIQHTVIGEMLAGADDGRRSLALADLFAGRQ